VPRYIVETPDGEMEYGNLEQLRQAVEIGLVSADALVNEEGGFHGRPASRVVGRPGQEVKSARRIIPIPSPIPSYVLLGLALLAFLYVELPRLTVMYPALWEVPGLAWLVQRPPSLEEVIAPPPWLPSSITWPAGLGWPQVATLALILAAAVRGLFAAAPQNAVFFGAVGAYLALTDRTPLAVACFAFAAVTIALGVRRLLRRRAAR